MQMDNEKFYSIEHWFDSVFLLLNESYQLDLRRIISTDIYQLLHRLSDFYLYDCSGLLIHLLAVTSHYLTTTTSFIYADNQLRHKLNLHLLLIARDAYERTSLVEHIKQGMNNIQSIRQTGKCFDYRHTDFLVKGFCLSDNFDEVSDHLQQQRRSLAMISTSNGEFIRKLFNKKESSVNADYLMIFLASKPRLFSRRLKHFDFNRYPSLEHWIIVINCLCSKNMDFIFEQTQANQLICDYLDKLSLKSKSLENDHPCLAAKYLSAREHVLRLCAALYILQITVETLFVYRQTFQAFGQADKTFFDNLNSFLEQTRSVSGTKRVSINASIVQSAIYMVDMEIKQFEIMFESLFTNHQDYSPIYDDSRSSSPPVKRLKTIIDPSYLRSIELAHELLLLPFVAFTRTSVYANSKIKRFAVYLDQVLEELKRCHLILPVRQGVQMIDGTRRRVDLLVKSAPNLHDHETYDKDLMERLNRYNVDYNQYIQTLGILDIGEKYRLSEPCYNLLNSIDYRRYLTVDLQRFAPFRRTQPENYDEDETNQTWRTTTTTTTTPKIEHDDSNVV